MNFRPKTLIIAVVVLIAGYFLYQRFFMGPPQQGMQFGAPPVSVAEVIQRKVEQWQEFSGRLTAVESAEIRPQVSGLIESIHFEDGEHVEKGRLLFTIDQRPYIAAKEAARARYNLAEAELRRAKTLLKEKAIPQREYDQRRNAAEVAKADLTRAELDYQYTLITAPVSGRVSRAEITVGNLVNTNGGSAPVLTSIVSDQPIYADFDIDEQSYLRYLQAAGGDRTALESAPIRLLLAGEEGEGRIGRLQSFDNRLNTGTGTIRVRALFDNKDGALIPGMFGRVRLGNPANADAILITDRAVGTDQSRKFVLVVDDKNTAQYRPVVLDGMADGLRVVQSGLQPGEKIIVDGLQRARPGTPVTPEVVPMDAPPAGAAGMPQPAEPAAEAETSEDAAGN